MINMSYGAHINMCLPAPKIEMEKKEKDSAKRIL